MKHPSYGYLADFGVWIHDLETDRWYAHDRRNPQQPKLLTGEAAHAFRQAMDAAVSKYLAPLHVGAFSSQMNVRVQNLLQALDAKQAKIDALMLEFCPGELPAEQRAAFSERCPKCQSVITHWMGCRECGYEFDQSEPKKMTAKLDSPEFYELMREYRQAKLIEHSGTEEMLKPVKDWIRKHFVERSAGEPERINMSMMTPDEKAVWWETYALRLEQRFGVNRGAE